MLKPLCILLKIQAQEKMIVKLEDYKFILNLRASDQFSSDQSIIIFFLVKEKFVVIPSEFQSLNLQLRTNTFYYEFKWYYFCSSHNQSDIERY